MKRKTFILASVAAFALATGSAAAGPCSVEIDALAKTLAAKDAGSGPTPGASANARPKANPADQHPPTDVMRQETEGKATSPEDVRRQNSGQPPAAQQGAASGSGQKMNASDMLARARSLDRQGKEAECMDAIRQAKELAGS